MLPTYDRVKVVTATTGTGTVTLGAATGGGRTFTAAGVPNNQVVGYLLQDNNGNWELGEGTYSTTGTLTRGVLFSSNSNAAISLSGSATVEIVMLSKDLGTPVAIGDATLGTPTAGDMIPAVRGTTPLRFDAASFALASALAGKQDITALLTAYLGLSATSGTIEKTGANTVGVYTVTAAGKALIDDADATAQRGTLGLGSLATLSAVGTAQITDGNVTNIKLATVSSGTFKGRTTAGVGAVEDLTATQATALLDLFSSTAKGLVPASGGGTVNFLRADGTFGLPVTDGNKGDITVSGGGATWAINAGSVINADLANVPTATFKGRTTAGTGSPEDLTVAQATALLNLFTSTLRGLVPPSGGGTTNFLRADGAWAAPAGAAAFSPMGKFGHFLSVPSGATAFFTNGASGVTFQSTGTASGIITDTTNFGKRPRIRWASAATAGSFINVRHAGNGVVSSRQTGFDFDCVWGHSDAAAVAEARSFCGIRGNTGDVGNVNPSTLTQIIGVGNDTGDANLQLMYNDGTGTATKVDLGVNFPANTLSADMYRLRLWSDPGAAAVNYRLDRLDTAFFAEGTVNTDIPSLTTMLGYTLFRGNGLTALAVRYDVCYLEMYPRALL